MMDEIMLAREVSAKLHIPEGTLRYYRSVGIGPRSFKLGRRIAYRRADVEAWIEAQLAATSAGGVA
jgi:predicted DNA-binding transcriptional regulator AlpA